MSEAFDFQIIVLIGILALITSSIHGATGVAGGFLLSAAIAPIIGIAPIVPVMSVALLISHSSRALLNLKDFDRGAFFAVSIPAVPCIIVMALLYGKMSSSLIAVILGSVILLSIPLRRWAKSRQVKAGKKSLSMIGAVYGILSGVSVGPGLLLIPFMLGYGLSKEAFVGTIAAIALLTNVTRLSVYGFSDLLTQDTLLLGVMIGLVTIPGNFIGKYLLGKITTESHAWIVDVLTVIGALNFFWLAMG